MKRFLPLFAALLASGSAAVAQNYTNLLENATTQVVNSAWTTNTITVGGTTSDNILYLDSGAVVTSSNAVVGGSASASNNTAYIAEDGVSWTIQTTLSLGGGASNAVLVADGGTVAVGDLAIASNNQLFRLGSGGTLKVANDFDAGMDGFRWDADSTLSVGGALDGMAVSNGAAFLNEGRDLVIDGGRWATGTDALTVGLGSEGFLATTNGGWIVVGEATTNDIAATAAGGILVASTNGATLQVDNGSIVESTGILHLGGTNAALAGVATVTNGGTLKVAGLEINPSGTFNLDRGGALAIDGAFDYDANEPNLNWASGGELSIGGTLTKSNGLDGVGRTLFLDGGDWTLASDLSVSGTSNQLVVTGGGSVTNANGLVSGTNNTVWVYGAGSRWQNNGTLGMTNRNNAINVQDGGRIVADALDIQDGNDLNLNRGGTLALTGDFDVSAHSNLNWNAGGNLSVGGTLGGMGTVSNEAGFAAILDQGRDLTLDGGSWISGGATNLIVGYNASESGLVVTNGGTLANADGYIGWGSTAGNNSVTVTGAGSSWTNVGGDLFVGAYRSGTNLVNAGGGNRLAIADGAQVFVGETTTNLPGLLVASTNGAQLVVGNGSATVEDALYLGLGTNTTGTATIRGGGTLSVADLLIADGSQLDLLRGGTFAIGTGFDVADRSTNGFTWGEGATLSVGGALTGMPATNGAAFLGGGRSVTLDGSNAVWNLAGSDLIAGLDDAGSALTLLNGGTLTNATAYIGWGSDAHRSAIALNFGSDWVNANDLWIGYNSNSNRLFVGGGSTASVGGNASIGNTNTIGNYAQVEGSNSLWQVDGNLAIGHGGGVRNYLQVTDRGRVEIGGDLSVNSSNGIVLASSGTIALGGAMNVASNTVFSGSGNILFEGVDARLAFTGQNIFIDSGIVFGADSNFANRVSVTDGAFFVAGSNAQQYVGFQTLAATDSTVSGYGTLDAFDSIQMVGGVIGPDPDGIVRPEKLIVTGDFASSGTVYRAQVFGNQYDQLIFQGAAGVDLAGLSADILVPTAPSNLVATILSADHGLTGTFAATSIVDRLLLYDAFLETTSSNVNVRIAPNNKKFSSALTFADSEGIRAGFHGMKNSVFTRTKQLRRNLAATAHAIPQEAFLLSDTNAPAGAMGPGDNNTIFDMHLWAQQFSGKGDYDPQGASEGFDLHNNGTTFGLDRLVGEATTFGFNYTYARASGRTTGGDSIDSETYWLGAYGEWVGKDGLYVDTLVALGRSNHDSIRTEQDYRGTASYRGLSGGAYADVGQYYHYKNLVLSPYAGLHALTFTADGHTETDDQGSQSEVEQFERNWVASALGLKLRHRFDTPVGRFQATGFAEWTHDFIQEDLHATLSANGLAPVDMADISPDADTANTGLGLSWICTDYMEIGIGYNGRFSENYEEHTGSLMLDLMF